MKTTTKLLLLVSAGLLATGCGPRARLKHHIRHAHERVFHLHDGRYAFADGGYWYWAVLDPGRSLTTATWSRGPQPNASELEDSTVSELDVTTNELGAPLSEAELAEIHAEANELGLSAEDVGGSSGGSTEGAGGSGAGADGGSAGGGSDGGGSGGGDSGGGGAPG